MKQLEIEHKLRDISLRMSRSGKGPSLDEAPAFALSMDAFMQAEHLSDKDAAEETLARLAASLGFIIDDPDDEDTDRVIFKWCPVSMPAKA